MKLTTTWLKRHDYVYKEGTDNLTVGGSLDLRNTNISALQYKNWKKNSKKYNIARMLIPKLQWQNGKYRLIDNMFCEILKQHKNIIEAKIGIKHTYIFVKNNIFAHGETIKQAYRDWLFKTSERDVTEYENLRLTDVKDINYWYKCYRTITGACAFGTEKFIEDFKDKLKNEMSLEEIIDVTKNQYGHYTFKSFFTEGENK